MILVGNCLEVMRGMADCSVDSIVTDPPYGLEFMGKSWDAPWKGDTRQRDDANFSPGDRKHGLVRHGMGASYGGKTLHNMQAFQDWCEAWARECLRVLKPGGHMLAFSGSRTYHRTAAGIEDAGFEIRDQIMWVYGSGFPKSHNGPWGGTALKPAHEPVVMARKPLAGTVEANWREHGTGALNIDACRVPMHGEVVATGQGVSDSIYGAGNGLRPVGMETQQFTSHSGGRWPANLIHDGSDEVLEAFPAAPGQQGDLRGHSRERVSLGIYGDMGAARDAIARADGGSAARFFYCAKATKADRDAGLEGFNKSAAGMASNTSGQHLTRRDEGYKVATRANHHPTVKPTDLMRYLCRLITPRGGLVLDPFAGSGSTGRAALMEGFQFVGIELDPEYAAIAEARIRAVQPGLSLGDAA